MFKPVPGYEGLYEVSDTGVVRSVDRVVPHPYWGTRRLSGKVLTQFLNEYPTVTLCREGKCTPFKVHHLVALAFIGPRPDDMDVCHADDVKTNNHVSNLRYDSHSNNIKESFRNGRHRWRLSPDDVQQIRRLSNEGVMGKDIALSFGVSKSTVSRITNNLLRQEA